MVEQKKKSAGTRLNSSKTPSLTASCQRSVLPAVYSACFPYVFGDGWPCSCSKPEIEYPRRLRHCVLCPPCPAPPHPPLPMAMLVSHIIRMKDVAQEQYTQAEAERGAGMTREKYPPAHPIHVATTMTAAAAALAGGGATTATAIAAPTPQTVSARGGGGEGTATKGGIASGMEEEDDPDL